MAEEDLKEDVAGGGGHPELAVHEGPVGVHGLPVPALPEEPLHVSGVDDPIVHQTPLLQLVEQLVGPLQVAQLQEAGDEVVVDEGVGAVALAQHLPQEVHGLVDAAGGDEALREVAVRDGGRAEGGAGHHVPIHLEGHVHAPLVAVCVDHVVVGDDVGDEVRLVEEEVEQGDGLAVPLSAVHGRDDGVAREHRRAGHREHRVTGHGGGGVKVAGTDQRLHAVVQAQPGAHQRRRRVRKPGGVRVTRRAMLRRRTNRVQGRLDAQPPFPSPPLRSRLFRRGKRKGTHGDGDGRDGGGTPERAEEKAAKRHSAKRVM